MSTLFNPTSLSSPPPQSEQKLPGSHVEHSSQPTALHDSISQLLPLLRTSSPAAAAPPPPCSEELEDSVVHRGSTRPRWNGSVKKWKHYTQNERQLTQSLEYLEAGDLSVHLYDAFSLNRRNYAQDFEDTERNGGVRQSTENKSKPYQRKDTWLTAGVWVPGPKWTAWPLSAQEVPHENDSFKKDPSLHWGYADSATQADKPSRWLEEMILTHALKRSKEKCYGRGIGAGDEVESKGRKRRRTGPNQSEQQQSDLEASDTNAIHSNAASYQLPVIAADDEKAAQLLKPSIRHLLQNLDDLLMGLRHSRSNHLDLDSSDTGTDTQTSRDSSMRRRSRSRSRPRRVRSTSKRAERTDDDELYNQRFLNPRDWSEVLGIASMVGWDSDVVQRAAARCKDLFGEGMTFRTLLEGPAEAQMVRSAPIRSLSIESGVSSTRSRVSSVQSEDAPTSWVCPEESCSRHTKPFNARWRVHDHVKRNHGYIYEAPASQSQPEVKEEASHVINQMFDGSLCCPVRSCKRHNKSYGSQWRLNEHMKKRHGYKRSNVVPESELSEETSGTEAASDSQSSAEEMIGGVHVDGFMKPIKARAGWVEEGKKSKRSKGPKKIRTRKERRKPS